MNTIDITNDRIFAIGLPASMNAEGEYTNHIDWSKAKGFTLIHSTFGEVEIVEDNGYGKHSREVTIRFTDTGYEYKVTTDCLVTGRIKNKSK